MKNADNKIHGNENEKYASDEIETYHFKNEKIDL